MDKVAKIAQTTIEENFNNHMRKLAEQRQEDELSRNQTSDGISRSSYQNGSKELTWFRMVKAGTADRPNKKARMKVTSPLVKKVAAVLGCVSARKESKASNSSGKQR